MASFTDTRPRQFNPYVQQLPVETMIAVGTRAEDEYNRGVQRVQGYLGSIAGIDVASEADRDYIQQRLSSLTSEVNKVASADWGNQAIVNQVGAMAAHIANDENIQNAMISTQKIRGLQSSYKTLREKDPAKYSAVNEAYDMQSVNEYLSNPNPGTLYQGPTSPWLQKADDVRKRLNEQVESIKKNPNKRTVISTVRDSDGNPTIMYQLDDQTWVSADDLKSSLMQQLGAEDLETLHRDAWFNLRGVSDNDILNRYLDQTDYEIKNRDRQILDRETTNALIQDPKQKEVDTENLNALKEYNRQLVDRRNKYVNNANTGNVTSSDITQLKDSMWTKSFIDGIANQGAFSQSSVKLEVNEQAKLALERDYKRTQGQEDFMYDLALKLSEKHPEVLKFDQTGRINIDMQALQGAMSGGGNSSYLSPITIDVDDPANITRVTEDSLAKDIVYGASTVEEAKKSMYSYYKTLPEFQDLFNAQGQPKDNAAKEQLDSATGVITRYIQAKASGMITAIPFMPKNPDEAKEIMNTALKAQIGNLYSKGAQSLMDQATKESNIRAVVPADLGNETVEVRRGDGTTKTYTVNELSRLAEPTGYSTTGVGEYGAPARTPLYRDEYKTIVAGPDARLVQQKLQEVSRYTELRNRQKEKVYNEISTANTPLALTISLPEKKEDPTFVSLQRFLQTSLGNKAESESVTPLQTYTAGGKKYVIAQYKPANAKDAKKGLVTEAVDVSSGLQFSPGSWLARQFNSDPMPELTQAIERLPNQQTPLDAKNNFADALFTTGESPHFFQVSKAKRGDFGKKEGRYYLTIAVPSEGGKSYTYQSSSTSFDTPSAAVNFVNSIFATQAGADEYYKTLNSR